MSKFEIQIESALGGMSPEASIARNDQYTNGFGFDLDQPSTGFKDAGNLVPTNYSDFSGSLLNGTPFWIINEPKGSTEKLYVYLSSGRLVSYTAGFTETTEVDVTGGNGSGAIYYNNYIYLGEATDITRWGPMDGTPAGEANVWTGSTLGTQTALTDTTYPSINGIQIPNHAMHVHTDGVLYFCDYKNGQGLIHKIKTTKGTFEGDTNNGSAYNVLDLPFGYAPVAIESFGINLAILAFPVTSHTTFKASRSYLFLWDTIADSFYAQIPLTDGLATAMLNHKGSLIIWSGSSTLGHRVSRYSGGYTINQIAYIEEGELPMPGGVDDLGDRIFWGSNTLSPDSGNIVYAMGYKNIKSNAINAPINTDASAGASSLVTSLSRARQDSFGNTDLIVGWKDSTNQGIDRRTGNTNTAIFRSQAYKIGRPYLINNIVIPLDRKLASNHTIEVTIFDSKDYDNINPEDTDGKLVATINNTNYPNSERYVVLKNIDYNGVHDFIIELKWTGTSVIGVKFPIIIQGETLEYGDVSGS